MPDLAPHFLGLTGEQRRAQILEFVADFTDINKYAPSVRDIARGVGMSQSGTEYQIQQLLATGALERTPGVARSLRVVQQAVDE